MNDPFSTEETIKTLQKMHADGVLSDVDLYKTYISLAYEALSENDVDSCLVLLNNVSPNYLANLAIVDMGEDVIFRDSVLFLAKQLQMLGLVDIDESMFANIPEAKA